MERLIPLPAGNELLSEARRNLDPLYKANDTPDWIVASINELIKSGEWTELNDRFYKNLAFGTGGIRGRTIGRKVTVAEMGRAVADGCPEHPAVGSNMFNRLNVRRAAQGLGLYLKKCFKSQPLKVVIAHDTRHFSKLFADDVSSALIELGLETILFAEERSTPQLSFTVRHLQAQAGVMITASHNPAHDNGFKAYFADGAQLVEPHASGVIKEVEKLLNQHDVMPATPLKPSRILDAAADKIYIEAVSELVLEPAAIQQARDQLKIVYTPLHGTGQKIIPQLFNRFGFNYSVVAAQATPDGRFPTVKSPNPENAEALQMAIQQASAEKADLVIATDPDDDRMGVAVRNSQGEMELLTGNQIGSILAFYRCDRLFAQEILNDRNKARAALIKTFVTTDLQKEIAAHFGVKCVETLTGFKYIGEKLLDYEKACGLADYDRQPLAARREAQLNKGTFFIFGGEESYGYSGADTVRDKDGNAAALMFAETAAWAQSKGQTVIEYLNAIYRKFGCFNEKLGSLEFEGAAGAEKIKKLLSSYRQNPSREFMQSPVTEIQDFGTADYKDVDGKVIPKEMMLIFHLANGSRMAVRGSGTEPKVKFYFFTKTPATEDLAGAKAKNRQFLDQWWDEVRADVDKRVKPV